MAKPLATSEEWRALARLDPFYVVAAWPGKRGRWTPEEFYAVGRSDWADAERHWRHYEPELGGTCVEVGCGAGRVTAAMAAAFERVVGLDVSQDMLTLARSVCGANVELVQVEGTEIPLVSGEADAVFTAHVLQHLDAFADVERYVRDMQRVLRPGGTLMLHTTLAKRPDRLWREVREALRLAWTRRMLARGRYVVNARMRAYRAEQIRSLLERTGFAEIELREFPMRSNGDPHPFWLARKPA